MATKVVLFRHCAFIVKQSVSPAGLYGTVPKTIRWETADVRLLGRGGREWADTLLCGAFHKAWFAAVLPVPERASIGKTGQSGSGGCTKAGLRRNPPPARLLLCKRRNDGQPSGARCVEGYREAINRPLPKKFPTVDHDVAWEVPCSFSLVQAWYKVPCTSRPDYVQTN